MTDNTTTPEEWYDEYLECSVKQRYSMLMEIIKQPLSPDFIEETEMDELLISMSDELSSNNLIDEYLALIQLFQKQQPKLYKKEFIYYDKFLIQYYLYTKQFDLLKDALVRFKKYPAHDLEYFLIILDLLCFYEQAEIVVDLCQNTYNSVKINPKVVDDLESELSWIIVTDLMDRVYQKHQQNEDIDWSKFTRELQQYGYSKDSEWLEDTKYTLTHEFNQELFLSQFKQKKLHSRSFNTLSVAFYIYMKEEKQMKFICSQAIWECIFEFLGNRELNFKQQSNPNTFFTFSKKSLDSYLTSKIYGFLSFTQAKGFGTLWGISYLYDFLLAKAIINEQVHRKIIKIVNQLKKDVLKSYENNWELWRYDFINRWQPDSNSWESELVTQRQLFTNSFAYSEPLSDEPGEGKLESFFGEMAEKLGLDLEKIRNEYDDHDQYSTIETESREVDKQLTAANKKTKKKKSNLGLAAQLYGKKTKD